MGKNCGGTLGAPLEKIYGEPEPFDVWWYPELREGGIPNDDLEMQLIWLKALEEVGPNLKAEHLAQYWLDHIGYNWDEYGLSKTNMRMGLLPPVAGFYNNWFKDSMGCPIRSEIWACVAPAAPRIAVRLAYEDAICDHAGGESVYGEMFNAAIESASFVVSEIETLIAIGRSYVADGSQTALAVDAALMAFRAGDDWKAARKRVLEATPSYNAQYSPINMAFQVIGLLYGSDFGDAICKAVNCGYDTDCTGATVGSILGILLGASGLPAAWTEPLGTVIATNESWGGLRNASTGPNPMPVDLNELTVRTLAQIRPVMDAFARIGRATSVADLYADDDVRELWQAPVASMTFDGFALRTTIDYGDIPVIRPVKPKRVVTRHSNLRNAPVQALISLEAPDGWTVKPASALFALDPHADASIEWTVNAESPQRVDNVNRLALSVHLDDRPADTAYSIILAGARALSVSCHYPFEQDMDIGTVFPPETTTGDIYTEHGRGGDWRTIYADGNELPLADCFASAGTIYVREFLRAKSARSVRIGVPGTCATKVWINDRVVITLPAGRRLRPNYDGDGQSYVDASLRPGWNEILIKLQHDGVTPFGAHFVVCEVDRLHAGIIDLLWTQQPWKRVGNL